MKVLLRKVGMENKLEGSERLSSRRSLDRPWRSTPNVPQREEVRCRYANRRRAVYLPDRGVIPIRIRIR